MLQPSPLPQPVLSVALPAIEDVKGGEGLSSLWHVFSKCKEFTQDGQSSVSLFVTPLYLFLSRHCLALLLSISLAGPDGRPRAHQAGLFPILRIARP